ncbi:MAG: hypothetical protein ACTSVV_12910 [Promethearchaeota archaeon]
MENEELREIERKLLELLRDPKSRNEGGLMIHDILNKLICKENILNKLLKNLIRKDKIIALPFRSAGIWRYSYYVPRNENNIGEKLENILSTLPIPLWTKVRLFRGAKTFYIGQYGKKPGFLLIDYGYDPPLIFRDRLAGGKKQEIINYKSRSKYKCTKNGEIYWYNYKGQQVFNVNE